MLLDFNARTSPSLYIRAPQSLQNVLVSNLVVVVCLQGKYVARALIFGFGLAAGRESGDSVGLA